MAEKRVSVRFAAIGGREVKAELRGIGQEGKAALTTIATGTGPASAGLEHVSSEAARARVNFEVLSAKAANAARALQQTAASTSPVVERINALTGVSPAIGRTTAELLQQGQALDDLRAKYNPVYAEIRRYRQAVAEVKSAHYEGAISADEMAASIAKLRTASLSAIEGMKGITAARQAAARASQEATAAAEAELAAMMRTATFTSDLQRRIDQVTGVTRPSTTAAEFLEQGRALDDLRSKYNPVYGEIRRYRQAIADVRRAHLEGALSADEMTAAIQRERQASLASIAALKGRTNGLNQMSRASRGATLRMQNLSFQLNDIGVSLAGGMNPFVVMAQQGTQIAQIYGFGQGGVGQAMRDVGGLLRGIVTRFPLVTAAVVGFTATVAGMRHEINKTSSVTVSFMNTAKAIFQVVGRGIANAIRSMFSPLLPYFQSIWDGIVAGIKWTGNAVINGVRLMVLTTQTLIKIVPLAFEAAWARASAEVSYALADMTAALHNFLAAATEGLNSVFRTNFDVPAGLANAAGALNKAGNDAMVEQIRIGKEMDAAWTDMVKRRDEILADDPMGDFFKAVRDQAIKNQLEDDKKKKKGGRSKEDQAENTIKSLERELALLTEFDPVARRMIELREIMADATKTQRDRIKELVQAIHEENSGLNAVKNTLLEYAQSAKDVGKDIGQAITRQFQAMEDAVAEFVKTGKLSFSDMVRSFLADMAKLATRKFITGPLSNMLGGFLDGMGKGGGGGGFGNFFKGLFKSYDGGGSTGSGPRTGGLDGRGGFLAMVHPQERIVDEFRGQRAPAARGGDTIVNLSVKDAESFRRSRAQVAADITRAVSMGSRVR